MNEKRINFLIKKLQIPREEAIEILNADKEIDKGAKLFELTPEQNKIVKKMKNTGIKTVDVYGKTRQRTRKIDNSKRQIIEQVRQALFESADSLTVTNVERQIDFVMGGRKFRIVLSAPRS